MRKDVLAKCYGGDITRKKAAGEAEGGQKEEMRNLGTVQIPTEAFMAVLKLDEGCETPLKGPPFRLNLFLTRSLPYCIFIFVFFPNPISL